MSKGIEGVPKEHQDTIRRAIRKRYTSVADIILSEGYWDNLSKYYGFYHNKMYLGCETDGHIHS